MKIIFFINKGINSATARFRGYLFANKIQPEYKTKIVRVEELYNRYIFNFIRIKKLINYFNTIKNTNKNDIIYLVKTVYNIDFLLIIIFSKIFLKKKIIFDFDDAIYLKSFTKTSTLILTKISDVVIVGSNTLYSWSKKRNKNTFKLPTSIPHNEYKKKYNLKKKKIFTIGWIGNGNNHYKNLTILKPIFEKLLKEKFKFKFKIVGLAGNQDILKLFKSIKGLNFSYKNHIKWKKISAIVHQLKTFDVGVMPLVSDEKTLGKCAFKIIEYMGAGVPVIASPVGENNVVIINKIDGFLCKNINDWVKTLIYLKSETKHKKKIVLNGFNKIKLKYSLENNKQKFFQILKVLKWQF